jgi:ketosteroid isomerase-like protein
MGEDAAARLAALETKVNWLADIEDIRLLRMRYHEAINEGHFDRIPEMFTEDGAVDFDYIGRVQGRPKITRFFAKTPEVLPFIKQFIHNHVVDVDGDAGTGFSYLEAKTVAKGEAFVVAARYDDVYARIAGRWYFRSMKLEAYFTVPLRQGWAETRRVIMTRDE